MAKQLPRMYMASGDIKTFAFTMKDTAGAAVDISSFGELDIQVFATTAGDGLPTGSAVITENLAGDVNLTGGGTTGGYELVLVAADTASLSGDYWLEVLAEDASGNKRTCLQAYLEIEGDLITS